MKILLDTHVIIWLLTDNENITKDIKDDLNNNDESIYYSDASVWEVLIKNQTHPKDFKLNEIDFIKYANSLGLERMPITLNHILNIRNLQVFDKRNKHNDPFDRLLLSQCQFENMLIYTHDDKMKNYKNINIKYI